MWNQVRPDHDVNRILLLVDDRLRGRLEACLSAEYRVFSHGSADTPGESFDLYIADDPALHTRRDWLQHAREAARPAFLPVLGIVPGDEAAQVSIGVDGLIVEPFEDAECLAYVRALMQTRRLSISLQLSRAMAARTGKAVESIGDAVAITDLNGQVQYRNQAFADLYGFTLEELNATGIPDTLFSAPKVAGVILDVVQRGQSWSGEAKLKTKAGRTVPAWLRADRIEDEAGKAVGMIFVLSDITELKRAQSAEREHRVLAEALQDTASTLTSTLDLNEVLDRILANVGRVVPHDAANVILLESDLARVVRSRGYAGLGVDEKTLAARRLALDEQPLLRQMAQTRQPVFISDMQTHASGDLAALSIPRLRSYIGVPILLIGKVIGFISLHSKTPHFFDAEHAGRLRVFADQAAIAIQNAQYHKQAQELAALRERQRLARDLHDAVSQLLFSASVIAESLPRLWEYKPEKVRPRLDQLHQLTRGAMAEMRTLLLELRPETLLEAEPEELLRQLVEAARGRTHIAAEVIVEGDVSMLPQAQVAFYYIAQEALNNIVKHAGASEATVYLRGTPEAVALSIGDNGRGFGLEQIPATSMGLRIIKERAASIGASLAIDTALGRGTTITVTWPRAQGKDAK
jgi:PAS domain S-box-containing protein